MNIYENHQIEIFPDSELFVSEKCLSLFSCRLIPYDTPGLGRCSENKVRCGFIEALKLFKSIIIIICGFLWWTVSGLITNY